MENALEKTTLIVNLYGGPGAGKTTCSWEIAAELKKRGYNAEYVPEYAKDLVYEGRMELLDGSMEHQWMIFQEQKHRLDRLVGKVDIVVTDSPILLNTVYLQEPNEDFQQMIRKVSEQYPSFNLVVRRGNVFQQEGRIHNEQQSRQLDQDILQMLQENGVYYGIYSHAQIGTLVSNIEKTYRRISAAPPTVLVAVESTDDFTDPRFHADLIDVSEQNTDGSYGKVVERYRLVKVNDTGEVVPANDMVYPSREQAEEAAIRNPHYKLRDYDTLIHHAADIRWKPEEPVEKEEAPQKYLSPNPGPICR